jgi:hypothetical protein
MNGLSRRIVGAGQGRLAVILLTYFAVLMALRLTLFPGGSDDDAEILYYTQSWALSYKAGQPPLYAWLVLAVEAVLGPTMATVIGLKYALLAAFYVCVYLAARRLLADGLFAALAPLAMTACFFIGWETVVNYSHTVLLLTAMAASLWLLLRLESHAAWRDYLWLALAVAAGLLAKYNFVLFLVPLVIGAWRHPGLRPRVFSLRFALALVLAVVLAGLPLAHFFGDASALAGAAGSGQLFPVVDDRLVAAGKGLGQFTVSTLGLVSPFLPVAVLMFPRAFAPLARPQARLVNSGRFLEAYLLALLVLAVAVILVTGASDVRNNWLVVWFPLPLYLLLRIKVFADAGGSALSARLNWFAAALMVVALAVPLGLAARGVLAPQTCRKCNFFIPYSEIARSLAAGGFSRGTIVAQDLPNQLAGNLRRYFPDARVVSTRWRDYQPPLSSKSRGKCLLIWPGGADRGGAVKTTAGLLMGQPVPRDAALRRLTLAIPGNPKHKKSWTYMVLDGAGNCR